MEMFFRDPIEFKYYDLHTMVQSQLIGRFTVMSSKYLVASSCSNCEFQDKPSSASYRFVSSQTDTKIDLLNSTLLELKMSQNSML